VEARGSGGAVDDASARCDGAASAIGGIGHEVRGGSDVNARERVGATGEARAFGDAAALQ